MKTARNKTHLFAPKSPPIGELDARVLGLIARGVGRPSTDSGFNTLALALFHHQFARNRLYRSYCESLDRNPDHVRSWKDIPAVPTTAFKDAGLTTLAASQRTAAFHSSGTTGHRPSRHFHNAATLGLYEAALWPMFESRVLEPAGPVCDRRNPASQKPAAANRRYSDYRLMILTPTPAEAPYSSLVHMMETVRLKLGAPRSAFAGNATLEDGRALARAVQSRIGNSESRVLLLGTAFACVRLLDAIRSLPLPPGSRVMETGGYKGRTRQVPREELHAQISAKLDVPRSHIISEYGMCELSSQFYAGSESAVFTGPPWTRVQIINPETGHEAREGGRGLVRICDLANRASAIAIQTEDVGVRRGGGFELHGRAPQAETRGCSLMTPS